MMLHHSFSYILVLITRIHVRYHPPTRFSHPWVNLNASTWSSQQSFIWAFSFSGSLYTLKITLYYFLHMHFTVCMIFGYHGAAIKWKQIFPRKEKNAHSHTYSVIAPSSVQSSAFKRRWKKSEKLIWTKPFKQLWTKSEVLWHMLYREFSLITSLKGRRLYLLRYKWYSFIYNTFELLWLRDIR